MPISIACPHCGQRLKAPDAAVGKKGKCKGCGGPITIAAPQPTQVATVAPPKTRDPEPPDDVYGLSDVSDPYDSELSPADSGAEASGGPLAIRASFDIVRVDECSADVLLLSSRSMKIALMAIGSVALFFVGAFCLHWMEERAIHATGSMRVPIIVILIPCAMMGFSAFNWAQLLKLGEQWTFDRTSRTFGHRRLFVWDCSWQAGEVGGLVLVVGKATCTNSAKGKGEGQTAQVCELFVVDPNGGTLAQIGSQIGGRDQTAVTRAAEAAVHAGRLLSVPVTTELRGQPATTGVRKAVAQIAQASGKGHIPHLASFRKPWLTVVNAGVALCTAVIIASAAHFLYIFHFYFGTAH